MVMKKMATKEQRLKEAKSKGYITISLHKNATELSNCWFRHCDSNNLPYGEVMKKKNHSFVSVDLITTNKMLTQEGKRVAKEYLKSLIDNGIYHDGTFYFNGEILTGMEVKNDKIEYVIKTLLEIVNNDKFARSISPEETIDIMDGTLVI